MSKKIPVLAAIQAGLTALNFIEKLLPTTEERIKRMGFREEAIKANAHRQAELRLKRMRASQRREIERALKFAEKHGLPTDGIKQDLQKLLESVI